MTDTTTYTLVNDFHNTFTRVRTEDRMLNRRQVLRAWRKLCGMHDCECGGYAGERGGRYFVDVYGFCGDLSYATYKIMDREEYERMMVEAGENWAGPIDLDDYFGGSL